MQQLSLGDTAEGAGMQEATPRADTHVTAQSPASTPLEALLHLAGQSVLPRLHVQCKHARLD